MVYLRPADFTLPQEFIYRMPGTSILQSFCFVLNMKASVLFLKISLLHSPIIHNSSVFVLFFWCSLRADYKAIESENENV